LVVGGGNGERIYEIERGELQPDVKISKAPPQPSVLAGGSGVNHSCRLLAMDVDVRPVIPCGNDDVAALIAETLAAAARASNASFDAAGIQPLDVDAPTPFSTIITEGTSRTILNHFSDALIPAFRDRVSACLETGRSPAAAMIGHIHADTAQGSGNAGAITEDIVHRAREWDCPVFVNFGTSQYSQGAARWRDVLKSVDVFQLDLNEMRKFFGQVGSNAYVPLDRILEWFKDVCTVVVTLERFGAVGQRKGSDTVAFAWPYDIDARDTTGAGDAFGAGVVKRTLTEPAESLDSDEGFREALSFGRLCGAYACGTLGGAHQCPTLADLREFAELPTNRVPMEDVRSPNSLQTREEALRDLWLLDRAFAS
jgi:sugar/nucleoside kinase (ribokinase family)